MVGYIQVSWSQNMWPPYCWKKYITMYNELWWSKKYNKHCFINISPHTQTHSISQLFSYHLLIIDNLWINILDPDQAWYLVRPDLDPISLTFWWYSWKNFLKKLILKKIRRRQKSIHRSKLIGGGHFVGHLGYHSWDKTHIQTGIRVWSFVRQNTYLKLNQSLMEAIQIRNMEEIR